MNSLAEWRWTSVLMIALTAVLLGLALPRFDFVFNINLLLVIMAMLAVIFISKKRSRKALYVCFIGVCFCLGWWRGSVVNQKLQAYQSLFYKTVSIQATALEDAVYNENGQLTFTATNISVSQPEAGQIIGQIEISGFGATAVYRGDRIMASGYLFPKRGANQAGMSFAQMSVLSRGSSPVDIVRREFAAGMQNTLPEPLSSFALGLLIGQRSTLSDALNDDLVAVGLIHIVAVSGYNLTVIINASRKLFEKRSRYQSLVFSLGLIALFLLMTGNSPSIVRAAVVSVLSLVAWYFGRRFRPMLLLLLAASMTALVNPLYLWTNIGWYLSFTAFFGVLVLAPLLQKRLLPPKIREKLLPSILVETVSAQLCTLPIILFVFGRLSIISIVANVLVVPAVPFAMLLSLFAGISGMFSFELAGIVSLPAEIVLEYMLSVSSLLSRLPFANVPFSISTAQMVYLYVLIVIFVLLLQRKLQGKRATIPAEIKE